MLEFKETSDIIFLTKDKVPLVLAAVSKKDLYPIRIQPGRGEMTEAWWRFGGSVPCINHPPGRATKTGIGCGTVPPADQPFVWK